MIEWYDIFNFCSVILIAFFSGRFLESSIKIKDHQQQQEQQEENEQLLMLKQIRGQLYIIEDQIKALKNDIGRSKKN